MRLPANEVSGASVRAVKVGRRVGRATLSKKLAVISGKRGGGGRRRAAAAASDKRRLEREWGAGRALLGVHGVTLLTRCLL